MSRDTASSVLRQVEWHLVHLTLRTSHFLKLKALRQASQQQLGLSPKTYGSCIHIQGYEFSGFLGGSVVRGVDGHAAGLLLWCDGCPGLYGR